MADVPKGYRPVAKWSLVVPQDDGDVRVTCGCGYYEAKMSRAKLPESCPECGYFFPQKKKPGMDYRTKEGGEVSP